MSIKISELPEAETIGNDNLIPIVQDGSTKKITFENMIGKAQQITAIKRNFATDYHLDKDFTTEHSLPMSAGIYFNDTTNNTIRLVVGYQNGVFEYKTIPYGSYLIVYPVHSYEGLLVDETYRCYKLLILSRGSTLIGGGFTDDEVHLISGMSKAQISEFAVEMTYTENEFEDTANKVDTVDETSTDLQYPSAEAVYEALQLKQAEIDELYDQIPTNEVSGETINVQDSSNLPIKDFAMLGNATQATTTGKQMLNYTLWASGSITDTGEETTTNTNAKSTNYIPVLPNTTYTFSTNKSCRNLRLCEYTNDQTFILRTDKGNVSANSITTGANTYYLRWNLNYDNTKISESVLANLELQLENGTARTPYEPFTGGKASPNPDYPQDIHVVTGDNTVYFMGKNLINISNENWAAGSWTADGEPTDNILNARGLPFIACLPNTKYTISTKNIVNALLINEYDGQQGHIQRSAGSGTRIFTITTTANTYFLRWSINYDNATTITQELLNTLELQLELGSTATSYEPYTSQTQLLSLGNIELAKKGDYTDRIYKDNGKWYEYHELGTFLLTGASTQSLEGLTVEGDLTRITVTAFSSLSFAKPVSPYICDKLTFLGNNDSQTTEGISNTNNTTLNRCFIHILTSRLTEQTMSGVRAWLQSNNLTIKYALATPTTTEITDTTLIGQLENILQMHTNKNVTNAWIEPSGTNAQAGLTIVYRQDEETLFDNMRNAIISLGGNV